MRPLSVFLSCCSIPATSTPITVFEAVQTNALVNDRANYANEGTVFLVGGASPSCVGNGARLGGLLLAAIQGVAVADAHDIQPYDTSAKASRGEQGQVIRAYPLLSTTFIVS